MWDTRIIPYFRTALGSHMPNLGIVECPSFKNELELKFLGPENFFVSTFMWVAQLFYFTNFFQCLIKKRRNEYFENF